MYKKISKFYEDETVRGFQGYLIQLLTEKHRIWALNQF